MSFLSSVFGRRPFRPWRSPYFGECEQRAAVLAGKNPLRSYLGFDVLEELEGGMARVLVARAPEGSLVAIKTIRGAVCDSFGSADRLADEAARLIGLGGRGMLHLVPEDVVADHMLDTVAVVLPYCTGGSLAGRAKHSAIPTDEVAYYGLVLAMELSALHAQGFLHLDLKPENVLLQKDDGKDNPLFTWRPVVSDYGLSVVRRAGETVPSPGGTPFYMSPEQAVGGDLAETSDVWSYGAMLYALLTGQSPLASVWPLSPQRFESQSVPPVDSLRNDCPSWLAKIIMGCLSLNCARRTQSFSSIVDAFLASVRIFDSATPRAGDAGPSERDAALVVDDRYAVVSATRLKRVNGTQMLVTFDPGWLRHIKDAETLFRTMRAGPSRRALGLVDSVLGRWEDPSSVLGQFHRQSRGGPYQPPTQGDNPSVGDIVVNVPISVEALWTCMDLRCRCLINLIEDQARPTDVAEMLEFCRRWYATGSYGLPAREAETKGCVSRELCLCRMAQGFHMGGDLETALTLATEAFKGLPDDDAVATTRAHLLRDLGRFDDAAEIMERGVQVAIGRRKLEMYVRNMAGLADIRIRQGALAEALKILAQVLDQVDAPPAVVMLHIADARKEGKLTGGDEVADYVEKVVALGTNLDGAIRAAEVLWWAGRFGKSDEIAKKVLRDPRLRLPPWQYYEQWALRLIDTRPN